MKRSEINKALKELEAACEKYHCYLPPFCHFTISLYLRVDDLQGVCKGGKALFTHFEFGVVPV